MYFKHFRFIHQHCVSTTSNETIRIDVPPLLLSELQGSAPVLRATSAATWPPSTATRMRIRGCELARRMRRLRQELKGKKSQTPRKDRREIKVTVCQKDRKVHSSRRWDKLVQEKSNFVSCACHGSVKRRSKSGSATTVSVYYLSATTQAEQSSRPLRN